MTDKTLEGRVALVTGASRGIGRAVALDLAAKGAHVIATARTQGGLEELDDAIREAGGQSTLVPLDLMQSDGIEKLAGIVKDRWSKLDILVANAGVLGTISPVAHVEAKVFDNVMAVNVTATWRIIRSVEPLLVKSDAGRALILSSAVAHSARAFWGPYAASKAAVETLARVWAAEMEKTPLRINSIDPGATRTAMRAQAMPGENPETLPHPSEVAEKLVPLCGPDCIETGKLFRVTENRFFDYRLPE